MIKNTQEILQFALKHGGMFRRVFYFGEDIDVEVRVTNYTNAISVHIRTLPDKFVAYTYVTKMIRSPSCISTLPMGWDISQSFVKYESVANWTMDEADDCVMMAVLQKT